MYLVMYVYWCFWATTLCHFQVKMSRDVRKPEFLHMRKQRTQIKLRLNREAVISVFVFATWIVQSLSFLNTKFQASSHFLRRRSLICVGPGRKPRRPVFWRRGSISCCLLALNCKVPEFLDARKLCCNLSKIQGKEAKPIKVFFFLSKWCKWNSKQCIPEEQSELGLHFCPRPICSKILDRYGI